jgi:hypothetical protein
MISQIVLSTHSRFQLFPCYVQAYFLLKGQSNINFFLKLVYAWGPFTLTNFESRVPIRGGNFEFKSPALFKQSKIKPECMIDIEGPLIYFSTCFKKRRVDSPYCN